MPPSLRTQELLVRFTKIKRRSISGKRMGGTNVVDLGVIDDVTGQVQVEMFDDMTYLFLSRNTAVSNGIKSIQQHGSCLGHL